MKSSRAALITAAMAMIALPVLSGCSAKADADHYVALGHYTTYGVRWQLDAFYGSDGGLCMAVDSPKGPNADFSWHDIECGFDHKYRTSSYWYDCPMPGFKGKDIVPVEFGPLPTNAVRIALTPHVTLKTFPFPSGRGLPDGRFWVFLAPSDFPSKADGREYGDPKPLDRNGKVVSYKAF